MTGIYWAFSTKDAFNRSLSHFRVVSEIVRRIGEGEKVAEILFKMQDNKAISKPQVIPIINAVVVERLGYRSIALNIGADVKNWHGILAEVANWNKFELVFIYHHPQLGVVVFGPNEGTLPSNIEFQLAEMMVVYAKAKSDADSGLEKDALERIAEMFQSDAVIESNQFYGALEVAPEPVAEQPSSAASPSPVARGPVARGKSILDALGEAKPARPVISESVSPISKPALEAVEAAKPRPEPKRRSSNYRITPKYSIQVTNELFHNGNVEAWKNIIESYLSAHADLEVHVFHDGQKINNINALFKWGKVKNGDVILISVAGEDIKGVSKLQRYLYEGASIRFEKYLKKDINKILSLF